MRGLRHMLRFFRVVRPVSPMMSATFVVLTVIGAGAVVHTPTRATGALAPVLLLQLFAASSSFGLPARRGHYDLLLTSGGNRVGIALAHWAVSIASGVMSWLVIGVVEVLVNAGRGVSLLASGTFAAVMLVSTLPWALTVTLPRFSGGIGWLLVLVTLSTTLATDVHGEWGVPSTGLTAMVRPALMFLVFPVGVVGRELSGLQLVAVAPALALALAAMVMACWWIARADVPLEAAQ